MIAAAAVMSAAAVVIAVIASARDVPAVAIPSRVAIDAPVAEPVERRYLEPVEADAPQPSADVCFPQGAWPTRLIADRGAAALCWESNETSERCLATDTRPVAPPPALEIRDNAICRASVCRSIGPSLAAALRGDARPTVTDDLSVLVIGTTAWSIDDDRPLRLAPPPGFGELDELETVGDRLLGSHATCAGGVNSCYTSVLVDRTGRTLGEPFGRGAAVALPDGRIVVFDGELRMLDGNGTALGRYKIVPDPLQTFAVAVDAITIVVAWSDAQGHQLAWIALPIGDRPHTVRTLTIAKCSGR